MHKSNRFRNDRSPMPGKFIVVITEGIDTTQRNLLQIAVTKKAISWWHEMLDVWLVETDESPVAWRKHLILLFGTGGSLLILQLPDRALQRKVAFSIRVPRSSLAWFDEVYSKEGGSSADEDEPPF